MSNKLVKKDSGKKISAGAEAARGIIEYVLAIVGIAVCVLVPLYLKEGYHNVGTVKYELYQWIMIVGFISLAMLMLVYCMLLDGIRIDRSRLFDTDCCVVLFLALAFVAAVGGGNFKECITGYNGWYMGLMALVSFGLLYYFFSVFGKYYRAVLACLLATAMAAFVIGILHRLLIDPIGTYRDIEDTYKNQFLSTLGQATWYSSFVCTVLPLGAGIFWYSDKVWLRAVSGVFTFAGFATLVTQNGDSAYIALAGFMAVFFWFSVEDGKKLVRFLEMVLLFIGAAKFMNIMYMLKPNPILRLEAISSFLVNSPIMWLAAVLVLAFYVICRYWVRENTYSAKAMTVIRDILFILLAVAVYAAVMVLILGAKGILPESISAFTSKIPYLTWSEQWGNGRGRTWAFSFRMFLDMDLWHKLFGVGPDGYAPYAYTLYQSRLAEMWGERTLTNAHNEWMNAVINYGLAGAAAYIGIFVTAIRNFAKERLEQPVMTGIIACVVSYMCHNFFCYQQVCCTPFVFILIGAGMYLVRKNAGSAEGE